MLCGSALVVDGFRVKALDPTNPKPGGDLNETANDPVAVEPLLNVIIS